MKRRAWVLRSTVVALCGVIGLAPSLPPGHTVAVTPDGTGVTRPPSSGPYDAFLFVNNTGSYTDSYNIACFGRVNIVCAGVDITYLTLDPGSQTDVMATYNTTASTGIGRVVVRATGDGNPAVDSGYYKITVSGPPPGYAVAVTPDGASQSAYGASTGNVVTFTVTNTGTQGTLTYELSIFGCWAQLTNCTSDSATVQVAQGASKQVTARFDTQDTLGTRTLTFRAMHAATGAQDNGSIKVTIVPPLVARDLCLTVAAGPAAAFECGDLRMVHGIPPVRTLGTTRTPVLLYNSQHAHPYPLVRADVALPTGDPLPTTVQAILTVNSTQYSTSWAGTAWGSPGQTRRIIVGFDALGLATGLYPYTLAIHRITGQSNTVLQTFTGTLPVVNRSASPFGAGWWLAGYEKLTFSGLPAGQVMWTGGDGSVRKYDRVGPIGTDTVYVAAAVDHPDTLLHTNVSRWVRLLPGGAKVKFTPTGIHDSTTNRLGYSTTFTDSSASGYLTRITVPPSGAGLSFAFGYTGSPGKLATIVAPDSAPGSTRVTTVSVVGGRVQSITDPGSPAVQFAYDPGFTNRILSRTDRRGALWRYAYDAGHRLNSAKLGLGSGASDTIRVTFCAAEVRGLASCSPSLVTPDSAYAIVDGPRTDSADVVHVWTDDYGVLKVRDSYGYLTTVTRGDTRWPALPTQTQEPSGRILGASYDGRGNLTSVSDTNPYGNGLHATTTYQWHQQWDVLTLITRPNGQLTRFDVSAANGNVNWVEDARGAVSRTTFSYVASGNGAGLLWTVAAPGGATTTFGYDIRGNVASSQAPLGWTTYFESDRVGRHRITKTPLGPLASSNTWRRDSTAYDVRDRVIRTATVGDAIAGVPTQTLTVRSYYDDEGNRYRLERTQTPNPTGLQTLVTQWVFDAANRPIRETAPDSKRDSMWYDLAGNLVGTKTRNDSVLTMVYDRANRLRRRVVPVVTYPERTNPGYVVSFPLPYDNYPGLHPYPWFPNNGSGLKINADTATFAYDSGGRLISADNGDARVRRTYFKNSNVRTDSLWIRNYTGTTFGHAYGLRYTYDVNGRPTALRHPAQLATGTGMRDSVRYVYNDTTGAIASVYSLLGNQTSFLYNLRGELVRQSFPGGIVDSLVYDALGRLTLDRIANGSTSPYKDPDSFLRYTSLEYADPMRVSAARNTNGWKDTVTAAYAGLGYLTSLTYRRPQNLSDTALYVHIGGHQASRTWTFDPLGNAHAGYASSTTHLGYGDSYSGGSTDVSYFASATSRIDSTFDGGGGHGFVYDFAGNTVFFYQHQCGVPGNILSDRASWYGADGQLRVAERRAVFGSPNCNFGDPRWEAVFEEYRYDALGRRVLVMSRRNCFFGADSASFQDCRVSRVRRTIWDGARELWEIQMPARPEDSLLVENDTATVTYFAGQRYDGLYSDPNPLFGRVAYTYAGGVDQPVSLTRLKLVRRRTVGDTTYFNPVELQPHWNWRGDAEIGTFADGGIKTCTDAMHCIYVQWRGVAFATGLASELLWTIGGWSPYGWFGSLIHDKVDGTETFYRRHRYVDPMTGRFTQEDPIGLAGGLNLYGFASGDPVNFGDPFGLSACKYYEVECWTDQLRAWGGGTGVRGRVLVPAVETAVSFLGMDAAERDAEGAALGSTGAKVGLAASFILSALPGVGEGARLLGFAPGRWLSHFAEHGAEFGYKTAVEYLRGANALIRGGEGVQTFVRAGGDRLFYREATNEFAVLARDGQTIRTYFKPRDGAQYWLDQTRR